MHITNLRRKIALRSRIGAPSTPCTGSAIAWSTAMTRDAGRACRPSCCWPWACSRSRRVAAWPWPAGMAPDRSSADSRTSNAAPAADRVERARTALARQLEARCCTCRPTRRGARPLGPDLVLLVVDETDGPLAGSAGAPLDTLRDVTVRRRRRRTRHRGVAAQARGRSEQIALRFLRDGTPVRLGDGRRRSSTSCRSRARRATVRRRRSWARSIAACWA